MKQIYDRLAHRDGGFICRYCKRPLDPNRSNLNNRPDDITIDHFIPLTMGGKDNTGNKVIACRACNMDKADMTPEQWCSYRGLKLKAIAPRARNTALYDLKNKINSRQKVKE